MRTPCRCPRRPSARTARQRRGTRWRAGRGRRSRTRRPPRRRPGRGRCTGGRSSSGDAARRGPRARGSPVAVLHPDPALLVQLRRGEMFVDQQPQPVERGGIRVEPPPARPVEPRRVTRRRLGQQLVDAGEVVGHGADRDAGRAGDLADAGRRQPALQHRGARRRDDQLPAPGRAQAGGRLIPQIIPYDRTITASEVRRMGFPSGEVAVVGVYESPLGVPRASILTQSTPSASSGAGRCRPRAGRRRRVRHGGLVPVGGRPAEWLSEAAEYMGIHPRWFDSTDTRRGGVSSDARRGLGRRRSLLAWPTSWSSSYAVAWRVRSVGASWTTNGGRGPGQWEVPRMARPLLPRTCWPGARQ